MDLTDTSLFTETDDMNKWESSLQGSRSAVFRPACFFAGFCRPRLFVCIVGFLLPYPRSAHLIAGAKGSWMPMSCLVSTRSVQMVKYKINSSKYLELKSISM